LSRDYTKVLALFVKHFSPRVWAHVQVLVTGAILARGQRTVTAVLRVMGLKDERHFVNYHRVLSRAVWSALAVSGTLLALLLLTFAPTGTVVIGGDDTIERRRGDAITAKGIYRDPVRSSKRHFVKASGLRWVTVMLLVPIPFAQRVWALPFLTVLAPSERYYDTSVRAAKKLTDWMRQVILQVRRWVRQRTLVFVADSSYACLDLLHRMTQLANPVIMVVRFRMDAALYEPAAPRQPHQKGRTRKKGKRLPTLEQVALDPQTVWCAHVITYWYGQTRRAIEITSGTAVWFHSGQPAVPIRWVIVRDPLKQFKTQALLCTDLTTAPVQIVEWFIQRWQLEIVQSQMTKTGLLASRAGRDDVTDLDVRVRDHHAVNQQFDQLAFLLKGGARQARLHPLTEVRHRRGEGRQMRVLIGMLVQLLVLGLQSVQFALEVRPPAFVFGQGNDGTQVGLRQAVQLRGETHLSLA
jgi:hypothetical protein